ncbi:MAG: sigma-70 family RNA polymerase sigma factor [Bacteroidota bacterium]|nr:sigma-70 family RNA polymerase sigma factor [Bacteroidota bacterium]
MIRYTDEAIVEGLRLRKEKIIKYVYKEYFSMARHLIVNNSGTNQDAEDVFQDALVIVYKRIIDDELSLNSSFKTFFYSICRNIWLQRLGKMKDRSNDFVDFESITNLSEPTNDEINSIENKKQKLYQIHFLNLSEDCQKVLQLFLRKISLREISSIMGYKTEKYAKTRKFKCKEELKSRIINDPNYLKIYTDD